MSLKFINLCLLKPEDAGVFIEKAKHIVGSYGLHAYDIEIELSNRLKTTGGYIKVKKGHQIEIKVNFDNYKEFGTANIIGILCHEFAHLIAFDRTGELDHSDEFKRICAAIGGIMNSHMAESAYESSATTQFIRKPAGKLKYAYI